MNERRTALISQLLPIISGFRHSQNLEARNTAALLQSAVRDLERLSDVELLLAQYNELPMASEAFFSRLYGIFSRE